MWLDVSCGYLCVPTSQLSDLFELSPRHVLNFKPIVRPESNGRTVPVYSDQLQESVKCSLGSLETSKARNLMKTRNGGVNWLMGSSAAWSRGTVPCIFLICLSTKSKFHLTYTHSCVYRQFLFRQSNLVY